MTGWRIADLAFYLLIFGMSTVMLWVSWRFWRRGLLLGRLPVALAAFMTASSLAAAVLVIAVGSAPLWLGPAVGVTSMAAAAAGAWRQRRAIRAGLRQPPA